MAEENVKLEEQQENKNAVTPEQKIPETPAAADSKQPSVVVHEQKPQPTRPAQPVVQQRQPQQPAAAPAPALSAVAESALGSVKVYVEAMHPSKMQTQASGANSQVRLYRACQLLVDKTSEAEFKKAWSRFLNIVGENINGAFKDTMIGRFAENMALSSEDRAAFFGLMSLATSTYDPRSRQAIASQFDFHRTLKGGFSEVGRARLEAYYGA